MKRNTRFCTSMRDNTKFGGLIHLQNFSPYPNSTTLSWIALRRKDYCRQKVLMNSVIEKYYSNTKIKKQNSPQ